VAALEGQDYPEYEIVVVDDGSRDETPEAVPVEFPSVRYLRQENSGPAAARNRGIDAARGDLIAFTDDDCLAPPDWLARLADGFSRYPAAAGVGGRLTAPADLLRSNALARYDEYIARVRHRAGDHEVVAGFECPAGGTDNMAYRRSILQAAGGFDATFPYPAAEDADLKLRLANAGCRFVYVPVAVTHRRAYTWPAFRQQHFIRGKGRVYFDRKWRGGRTSAAAGLALGRGLIQLMVAPPTEPGLLRPALEELWFSTLGQWAAIRELRA
jgi:GT2 family glycosyltransferase